MPTSNETKTQPHVKLKQGDVGRYVFLPGDPGRCEKIASFLDRPVHVAQNREFNTFTGYLNGQMVSVTSTGIGCPSTAIAVEELSRIGADTFIRIGTSGSMQQYVKPGDLAIVSGAIRDEGTSLQYMPVEFPAIADFEIIWALKEGAIKVGASFHIGITQSKDSYYGEKAADRMPVADYLKSRWKAWMAGGAICSEMESSALFIVSSILRRRAGGIMLVYGHPDQKPMTEEERSRCDLDLAIRAGIEGMRCLIARDLGKA